MARQLIDVRGALQRRRSAPAAPCRVHRDGKWRLRCAAFSSLDRMVGRSASPAPARIDRMEAVGTITHHDLR
jgi:hypothetical protein